MSITANDFKNYKAGDHVTIIANGSKIHGYFTSVHAERINLQDMNFREHSYALSELSEVPSGSSFHGSTDISHLIGDIDK
ncbi:hypothetical protein [Pseudomonas sp. SMN5]|uniref:hypothetical protein n=1 Tax=Pseudomonas sp. SMN5 TaxID=3390198 RepID=UPI003F858BD4